MTTKPPAGTHSSSIISVPALVTYWLLGLWSLMIIGVYTLVIRGVMIEGTLLAILTGLIGTQTTLLVSAVSFWVGATLGGKEASERLAEASKISTAAVAQLAGAGPPPPQQPVGIPQEPRE